MSTFRLFKLLVFLVQKGVFSVQNIVKKHFTALYCIKKKFQKWPLLEKKAFSWPILRKKKGRKWPFLDQNPLEKCQFSYFMTSCFYSLQRRFFVLKYRKGHFLMLQCLKKKVAKMPIFGPKPWVNHMEKVSIFRLFEPLIFIAQKGVFSFQNIVKNILLLYIAQKKKFQKWPLSEKCQFLDFLKLLCLQPRKVFFGSRIS